MRCIYGCPENAIRSRGMQFTVIKDGYDIRKFVDKRYEKSAYITENTRGYFKHLKSYVGFR